MPLHSGRRQGCWELCGHVGCLFLGWKVLGRWRKVQRTRSALEQGLPPSYMSGYTKAPDAGGEWSAPLSEVTDYSTHIPKVSTGSCPSSSPPGTWGSQWRRSWNGDFLMADVVTTTRARKGPPPVVSSS